MKSASSIADLKDDDEYLILSDESSRTDDGYGGDYTHYYLNVQTCKTAKELMEFLERNTHQLNKFKVIKKMDVVVHLTTTISVKE